ncbi:hypothetical protein [Streptomyces murinus]
MMRAEAESVMGRRSRRRAVPDAYAIDVWQSDVAVRFAHGATQSGDTCEVGAQAQPDTDPLGMITLVGRGQDDAANTSVKWVRDQRPAHELELVRVENINDRYPEEQRTDFSLTRFTAARSESPSVDGWALPTGLPPATTGSSRGHRRGRQKTA